MLDEEIRALFLDALQVAIGAVWVFAAVMKVRTSRTTPYATEDRVRRLLGGPPVVVRTAARGLAPAEFTLGAMLIFGWHERVAALVSAALFTVFALLIGRAVIQGSLGGSGCGCFGARAAPSGQGAFDLVAPQAIARNFVLAVLALAVAGGVQA